MVLGGGMGVSPQSTSDAQEQVSHAQAPVHYQSSSSAKTIFFAMVGMVAIIYILHIVGRMKVE